MPIRSISFCSGSLALEGRLAEPDGTPRGGIVLCHPHPQYQGSMSSVLVPALQRAFVAAGYTTLRFNFRGVGKSEGSYDAGRGETDDALAALDEVAKVVPHDAPLVSCGWSFGSVVALRAAIQRPHVEAAVAIAPPLSGSALSPDPPPPDAVCAWGRPVLVIAGARDTISPLENMRAWIEQARAELVVVPGADHFFRPPEPVADAVLEFLRRHDVG
jgi:uncharacterized protein